MKAQSERPAEAARNRVETATLGCPAERSLAA